jgi:hypothetical protein
LEKINDSVYHIELPPEYQMHPIINQEHLTKYRRRDPSEESQQLPEFHPLAREEVYEVDRIVGHKKIRKKGILYRVRWKGYGSGEDTYEPESNLQNAFSQLRDYKANASLSWLMTRGLSEGSMQRQHQEPSVYVPPRPTSPDLSL